MDILNLTLLQQLDKIKSKEITSQELVEKSILQIEKYKHKNAILEVFDDAIELAKKVDEKIKQGQPVGKLAGIPIIIKDNILYKGKIASSASKMLENFVSPYTSTVVKRLLAEDAVIIARANMDELAMGGSNEKSAFGPCLNAFDDKRVAGGSSGGSAASVALNMASASLGSDTGGSIRQPASFNGLVGIKPTYGRVPRYGVMAFASSLDQVGPLTKDVKDNAYLLSILAGHDENDQTSQSAAVPNYLDEIKDSVKGLKIGVFKQLEEKLDSTEHTAHYYRLKEFLVENGAEFVELDQPYFERFLELYYIISPAEAASNFGTFDGVKFTSKSKDAETIEDVYTKSRTEFFGKEVKLRIMLGNYVLSKETTYKKAKLAQQHFTNLFKKYFEQVETILLPTTIGEAFELNSKNDNPTQMYLEDAFTVLANIIGIPAISVPYAFGKNNLPIGIQIMANHLEEGKIYNLASYIETHFTKETK